MPAEQLEARVRHITDAAIVDLKGDIAGFAEEELNRAYTEAESQGTPNIVLNFSNVDYINSTGIALIVGLMARARKARLRLLVYGLSDHYLEIFQITRLADFMDILPDEESVLADVGEHMSA